LLAFAKAFDNKLPTICPRPPCVLNLCQPVGKCLPTLCQAVALICTPLPPDLQDVANGQGFANSLPVTCDGHAFANGLVACPVTCDGQRFACNCNDQAFANGLPVTHLPTVCLFCQQAYICQRFACDGDCQALPTACLWLVTAKHLPTVCLCGCSSTRRLRH
jgi:hypothetical protein